MGQRQEPKKKETKDETKYRSREMANLSGGAGLEAAGHEPADHKPQWWRTSAINWNSQLNPPKPTHHRPIHQNP